MPLCSSANVGVSYHLQRLHPFPDWVSSVTESPSCRPMAVPSSHVISVGGAELVVDAILVEAMLEEGSLDVGTLDEGAPDKWVIEGMLKV
jgi:hypothetical protein